MTDVYWAIAGLVGLVGLIAGAERVVEHAAGLMRQRGLSGGFIGLTVISVGTSLPEMLAHVVASVGITYGWRDMNVASATVLGMNVGSDIAQQTLLIGAVGLVGAVYVSRSFLRRDFVALVAAALFVWLMSMDGSISRIDGAILIVAYGSYLVLVYRQRRVGDEVDKLVAAESDEQVLPTWMRLSWIIGGLLVIVLCGEVVLRSVERIVKDLDIGGSLIGVVIIGLATSVPELATAVTAIRKKQTGLSIGTLIGSNITNPTLGIGLGAVISSYTLPTAVLWYDMPVKVATGALILGSFVWDERLTKWESVTLLAIYVAYIAVRGWMFPGADVY